MVTPGAPANPAHALAHSWQAFAWLRGFLGLSEGSANPAGMKATAEWFPAKERDVFSDPLAIPRGVPVHLRVEVDYERLLFACRIEGEDWVWMPGLFDAGILSDESGPAGNPNFTGAFVGICCQDLTGARGAADFDYFHYQGRDYLPDPKKMAFPI